MTETFASAVAPPPNLAIGRSATRKAMWRLIPLIALGYGTAYMDRVNISFASLQMNRDLHFSATVYGFGAGLFFVSYAACEVPSNLLLCHFGARRWLSRILFTWGFLAVAMMFVRTAIEFYVIRFLLGMAEAGFFPGVVYYLTQWFPPNMRARAISGFYVAFPLSSAVMGALAGALLNLQGRLHLAGWQWLFLVEGLPAIVLGIAFFFLLPDDPTKARWLTVPERSWLIDQIEQDACSGGHRNNYGRALLDSRVLEVGLIFLFMLGSYYAYAFSAPAILLQLTSLNISQVGYLISAMGLVGAAAMLFNAQKSDRTGERYWHTAIPFFVMTASFLVCGIFTRPWLAVPAMAAIAIGYPALLGPLNAIPPTFLKGKSMAAGIAAMNTIGMLGGFVGPYWMGYAKDLTGDYQRGLLTLAVPSLLAALIILWMRHVALPTAPAKIS
jgi:MFS transporter, ACS family, tartrate transporter